MNTPLSVNESTSINIDGQRVIFNVCNSKLIEINNQKFSELVQAFVTNWNIKENTENSFAISTEFIVITTADKKEHHCIFVAEKMQEADTCIETMTCHIEGIESIQEDYLEEFNADIGRVEIETLITDAILSDSTCETWPEYQLSFCILGGEDAPCQ